MSSANLKDHSSSNLPPAPTNLHRIITGLLLLVVLFSWSELDPDPLNLVRPLGGTSNLLGLPGALIAGLFVNVLGRFSFALPFILIFLQDKEARRGASGYFRDAVRLLSVNAWFSLLFASVWPTDWPGLAENAGIWGYYSVKTFGFFPGKLASLLILSFLIFRSCMFYSFNMSLFILLQPALKLLPAISNISSSFSRRISEIRVRFFRKDFFSPKSNAPETAPQTDDKAEAPIVDGQATSDGGK